MFHGLSVGLPVEAQPRPAICDLALTTALWPTSRTYPTHWSTTPRGVLEWTPEAGDTKTKKKLKQLGTAAHTDPPPPPSAAKLLPLESPRQPKWQNTLRSLVVTAPSALRPQQGVAPLPDSFLCFLLLDLT